MASTSFFHIFPHLKPSPSYNLSNSPKLSHSSKKTVIKCSSQPQQSQSQSQLPQTTELEEGQENSPIQIRSKAQLVREKKPSDLAKTEPPNFEIGWKRTKKLPLEKKKGYMIMDFLDKLEGLMSRQYGTTELLAKAGGIVAERVREEAEILRNKGEVDDRLVVELFRVLKLMEMELEMVKAAKKEETLNERLEQAKARCRQAILVADSF
ncbi:protein CHLORORESPIRATORY REDUCTION 41, chloroplastic [Nymphaea colorata]|uniref:Chlororespiratory reduction 41 n=1 Tax=Nymphaea colorata TaxID=210225 RepID=A0A5K0W1T1_9MAGN|nr:protein CHLORORESPIRATORY REDUCTION 41, chloroplastic [Nymphaea colorata]